MCPFWLLMFAQPILSGLLLLSGCCRYAVRRPEGGRRGKRRNAGDGLATYHLWRFACDKTHAMLNSFCAVVKVRAMFDSMYVCRFFCSRARAKRVVVLNPCI